MAKEYARTQRVADYLQRELAALIQHEVRDPRVGMVSITGVDVSRDLGHATEGPPPESSHRELLGNAEISKLA